MKKKKQKSVQKLKEEKDTTQVILTALREKLDLRQNVKSSLILTLMVGGAVAGRAALQTVPSVETVTPFSILAGFMLGPIYGFIAGASGFYASNFVVWGGQGPWTIFQMLGAGFAGMIGGIFGRIWKGFKWFMASVFIAVLAYEVVVNIGGALIFSALFGQAGMLMYFLTSLPFTAVHLASSLAICAGLWKCREKLPKFGNKLVEKTRIILSKGPHLDAIEKELYQVAEGKEKLLEKISIGKKYKQEKEL